MNEVVRQGKQCSRCGKCFPATTEYFYLDHPKSRDNKLRTRCKKCVNSKGKSIDAEDYCAACGATGVNLRGDIDIATGTRYGYLCAKCYQLVSLSKGDTVRLSRVANYLKKTHPQDNPPR